MMKSNSVYRTHYCNELRGTDVGKQVKLAGWVKDVRNFGKMFFITLRDHYGVTQLSFPSDSDESLLEKTATLKPESVIFIEGEVVSRGKDVNKDMETGEIEVVVSKLHIDSLVKELPFQLYDENLPNEELRLKYRFIDLRRDKLQKNLKLRFKVMQSLRNYLADKGSVILEHCYLKIKIFSHYLLCWLVGLRLLLGRLHLACKAYMQVTFYFILHKATTLRDFGTCIMLYDCITAIYMYFIAQCK